VETLKPRSTSLCVDEMYDLPYALAYGKISWFLWEPLDTSHRAWRNRVSRLEISQEARGDPITILNGRDKRRMQDQLGLWYDSRNIAAEFPDIIRILYTLYPMRVPIFRDAEYFDLLFAAAVLSPQVSWKVNSQWVSSLLETFGTDLCRLRNYELNEIEEKMQARSGQVRRFGYHGGVLVHAFQDLFDKFGGPQGILTLDVMSARKHVLEIYGIGPKVAMFLLFATHGDINAACLDRHAYRNAIKFKLVGQDCLPYFPQACKKYIWNCDKCPYVRKCAAGQLMTKYESAGLLSSLLYFPSS
jgi:endonuclease III